MCDHQPAAHPDTEQHHYALGFMLSPEEREAHRPFPSVPGNITYLFTTNSFLSKVLNVCLSST